jgi:hypothetical protein
MSLFRRGQHADRMHRQSLQSNTLLSFQQVLPFSACFHLHKSLTARGRAQQQRLNKQPDQKLIICRC